MKIENTFLAAIFFLASIAALAQPSANETIFHGDHRLRDMPAAVATVNTAPGDLDPTFGNGGRVYSLPTEIYAYSGISDMVLQPDGKIVVSGFDQSSLMLARYLPNGQPDTTFGVGGKVLTSLIGSGGYSSGNDVVLQSDGKIVVIGNVYGLPNSYVARYLPSGTLDPTFSGDGIQMIDNAGPGDWGGSLDDVAVQQDGKIVVLTSSSQGFTVVRLNSDGAYDGTFGTNGRVTTSFRAVNLPSAVAIQPDGKIVVAGGSGDGVVHETQSFVLARFNTNGSVDTSFGNLGKVITSVHYSNRPADIVLQADNKLVVVGTSSDGVLMRFQPNGAFDLSFGESGVVHYNVQNSYTAFRRVAIQPDGRIVASSNSGYKVVRFLPNGSLDTLFGSSGVVVTNFPDPFPTDQYISYSGGMSTLVIQPDGRIIGAGNWYGVYCDGVFCDSFVSYPAIARYLNAPVPLHQLSGRVTTSSDRAVARAHVTLDDGAGNVRYAMTNPFGYFRFFDVPTGTYTVSVRSKRYGFTPRTISVSSSFTGLDFVALSP